jgi:hypothetical protein
LFVGANLWAYAGNLQVLCCRNSILSRGGPSLRAWIPAHNKKPATVAAGLRERIFALLAAVQERFIGDNERIPRHGSGTGLIGLRQYNVFDHPQGNRG